MPPFNIAIIGAGPAGCMLARLLLQSPTPPTITIFESEPTPDYRSQGGTLDLHPKNGLKAMKAAGLYEEFLKYARYESAVLRICDKNMKTYFGAPESRSKRGGNPEIDRAQLRQLLMESLPKGTVRWGMKLVSVGEKDHALNFENGDVVKGEDFDLIVGADGAWSRVREVIDGTKPLYSGITRYWTTIPKAETEAPEVVELINRGNLFTYSDGKGIIAQQMFDGCVDVSIGLAQDELKGVEITSTDEMLKKFGGWDERLVGIVKKAESKVIGKSMYMLPVGYTWKHRDGVTVIGDAAHLMTPFGGEGVNLAFGDCVKLSEAISKAAKIGSQDELNRNVRVFEEDMWRRAEAAARMSTTMGEAMFLTPGAPRASIERWLLGKLKHELAAVLYPLAVAVVYTGYFAYKLLY
ncbi:FAD/NAD(P)-binding domain-containing protein [Mollisia scopiformis]|uniref:FAD/NAD(P)-binding domain-containing protein n=1 Tax=Mollisia scopiformis TaxID=149040 RepID=A0A194XEA4_MOLSC|nr:FAD/NAD(P)-binding domain-containing protein [Mollisia scopiformis]KUJ18474.1 FAD/NAD(P)-binding domain-containing protein [Mollisia scopiformis]